MDVQKLESKRFLSLPDQVFVIPVYQRNYDWKIENCKQLFQDIVEIVHKNENHFIGTICTKIEKRDRTVIIDGQQRITTLMILLKAISDESSQQKYKEIIKNKYLENQYAESDEVKIKLKPIKKDKGVYNKLISYDFSDSDYSIFDDDELNSNVVKNYKYFRDAIHNLLLLNDIDLPELIDAVERLELVELTLENENPQVIFESLNSTGLSLTNADLLRNYLLMSLDYTEQERLYNLYWHEIENMIGSDKMEQFMVHFLVYKKESSAITKNGKQVKVSAKNLYYAFKKQYPINNTNKDVVEDIFAQMLECAKYYKHFIYTEQTHYNLLSKIDKNLYELFALLSESSAAVLMMYLLELHQKNIISEDELVECIRICISYCFRAKICNSKSITMQFAPLTIQKLKSLKKGKSFIELFWNAITSGKGQQAFPSNEDFIKNLVSTDIYSSLRSNGTKYLLYSLEKNAPYSKELPEYKSSSIEHLMPQTLSEAWKQYLSQFGDLQNADKNLHKLGNLALTNYNSELSNKSFDEKVKTLALSKYHYTSSVCAEAKWTSVEIEKRSKVLADLCLKVWPLKDGLLNRTLDTGKTYDLTSDFDSFTGFKPLCICVCDEEFAVSSWSEFLVVVARKFCSLDPELYLELSKSDLFPSRKDVISKSNADMKRYGEIGNGYYIYTNFDAADILKCVNVIADFYDKKHDTNCRDNIWFTTRDPNSPRL